ncbi:unnamed protein product [Clavelina lepadiformis]|uniref:Uncharacterized protein n=1 Tax=Clavelina lepadiformis TaxID=159417 RepID=A0ABP0GK84_CLALP
MGRRSVCERTLAVVRVRIPWIGIFTGFGIVSSCAVHLLRLRVTMSNITEVEDGQVPAVVYEQQAVDPEGYLSEQLKSLKQRRSGLIGAVTKLQNKLKALITSSATTHPMVAEAKDNFDVKLASCLQACQEYFQKIPQDTEHDKQRTDAIEKLQEMKERQREADEQYTVYTQQCNMDASTQPSYVSARSSKASTCSSARRKRLRQAQIDAEQAKFEAQLTFDQDMIEAKAEEERLEAETKRLEAEAKRLEAEAKNLRLKLNKGSRGRNSTLKLQCLVLRQV